MITLSTGFKGLITLVILTSDHTPYQDPSDLGPLYQGPLRSTIPHNRAPQIYDPSYEVPSDLDPSCQGPSDLRPLISRTPHIKTPPI